MRERGKGGQTAYMQHINLSYDNRLWLFIRYQASHKDTHLSTKESEVGVLFILLLAMVTFMCVRYILQLLELII